MGYCLWYQTRVELGLYLWGVGCLCNVLADLIVLRPVDVILALGM